MASGCPMGNIANVMKYPVNDARVQALGEIEAGLLSRAVSLTDNEDMVISALDARAARQALLSAEVVRFENEVELVGGSGHLHLDPFRRSFFRAVEV